MRLHIALICTDVGHDLSQGPEGPWLSMTESTVESWTIFYPTFQHRPRVAFKAKAILPEEKGKSEARFPQSASLLPTGFSSLLDLDLMKVDAFYALDEVFRFSASSHQQLLNLMEKKIGPEAGYSSLEEEQPTLSNLLYFQEILDSRIVHLKENVEVLERRGGVNWPRVPKLEKQDQHQHQCKRADMAAEALLYDFEHLLERAIKLSERCTRGTSIIMNNTMLVESRRAIRQAKWVGKLTLVAFFYIPLSFTTSFFGMNVIQLGTGRLSIWVWFVTSLPLFSLSLVFLYWDMRKVLKMVQRGKGWFSGGPN
jgi:hypothetical protein